MENGSIPLKNGNPNFFCKVFLGTVDKKFVRVLPDFSYRPAFQIFRVRSDVPFVT